MKPFFFVLIFSLNFLGKINSLAMDSFLTEDNLDSHLARYISQLKPLRLKEKKKRHLFELGKALFHETEWSGEKNISCATCHGVGHQGVDWLPFSIGVGGHGEAMARTKGKGKVIMRSTPHLFNLFEEDLPLLWDGGVSYDADKKIFQSPLSDFNGPFPRRRDLTAVLTSSLALQAFFPLISPEEMMGKNNEIANAKELDDKIEAISKRIFQGEKSHFYLELMKKAWPDLNQIDYSIAHLLESVAHFERQQFFVNKTPWDQYLQGNKKSLSFSEKKGALLFFGKARCFSCHQGDQLGGREFKSVFTPSLYLENVQATFAHDVLDQGRELVTGDQRDRYRFKVPSLRNVAFTFPYMHNGAFMTLEQVLDHHLNVEQSLMEYNSPTSVRLMVLNSIYQKNYSLSLKSHDDANLLLRDTMKEQGTDREELRPIFLNESEKKNLIEFLRHALAEPFWNRP